MQATGIFFFCGTKNFIRKKATGIRDNKIQKVCICAVLWIRMLNWTFNILTKIIFKKSNFIPVNTVMIVAFSWKNMLKGIASRKFAILLLVSLES
jgi:hypothetical protein